MSSPRATARHETDPRTGPAHETGLCHAGLLHHEIDADGSDPPAIEQLRCGFEDPLTHIRPPAGVYSGPAGRIRSFATTASGMRRPRPVPRWPSTAPPGTPGASLSRSCWGAGSRRCPWRATSGSSRLGLSRARRRGEGGLDRRARRARYRVRRGLRDHQAGAAARTASASSRTAGPIAGRGSWP
jgi:hypothetical protein